MELYYEKKLEGGNVELVGVEVRKFSLDENNLSYFESTYYPGAKHVVPKWEISSIYTINQNGIKEIIFANE